MQELERLSALLSIALACGLVACEKKQNDEHTLPPPAATPSAATAAAVPSGKTEAPTPSASAAAAPPAENDITGTWEGRYEAKKGDVEMPPKVKDKVRTKDDGKSATGKGTITFTIGPDGELKGKTDGALGTATLSGKAEGKDIRATFFPDDALAKLAMFGIVQGKFEDNHITGRIRVANGDASIVREAEIDLKKK